MWPMKFRQEEIWAAAAQGPNGAPIRIWQCRCFVQIVLGCTGFNLPGPYQIMSVSPRQFSKRCDTVQLRLCSNQYSKMLDWPTRTKYTGTS